MEIHAQRNERRLAVGRHQGIDLVLDRLNAVFYFFTGTFPSNRFRFLLIRFHFINVALFFEHALENFIERFTHERRQNPINAVDALSAVLAAGDLRNNLRRYRTGDLERFR